jgi:hypothetical protein
VLCESLNAPQTVFCLFYAIFFGFVANAQVRWKAFDWPLAVRGGRDYAPSRNRLLRSLFYLVLLPLGPFLTGLILFAVPASELNRSLLQLVGAYAAAHAAFGPYRSWLSGVERCPGKFYYPAEFHSDYGSAGPQYFLSQPRTMNPRQCAREKEFPLDSKWANANLFVGSLYVVFSILVGRALS